MNGIDEKQAVKETFFTLQYSTTLYQRHVVKTFPMWGKSRIYSSLDKFLTEVDGPLLFQK